jgi:hypothetical protein
MKRIALFVVVAVLAACPKSKPNVVDAGAPADDVVKEDARLKPTFDAETPPDPRALDFCKALYDVPEQKKAVCCKYNAVALAPLAKTCAGQLSDALKDKDLVFDDAKAKQCSDERSKALDGCAWVGIGLPPTPEVCQHIFSGSSDEGARCRSSLECKNGLRCQGSGPTHVGRCAPPLDDGSHCGSAIDALSVVVDEPSIERNHPQCKGVCGHLKCVPIEKSGDPCVFDSECGDGNRCEDKKCLSGRIAIGKQCKEQGCVDGATCFAGTCQARHKEGEACDGDADCAIGGCFRAHRSDEHGTCGMRCSPITPP